MHILEVKEMAGIVNAAPQINNNAIRYSKLYTFESQRLTSKAISIKYVMKGVEYYETGGETIPVSKNQYLLLNQNDNYKIFLHSAVPVEGLCVDIDCKLLQQVLYAGLHNDDYLMKNPHSPQNVCTEVMDGIHNDEGNCLDRLLQMLAITAINNNGILENFTEEDYYTLTASLVCTQQKVKEKVRSVFAKKPAVQKELYKRISATRHFINDTFTSPLRIDTLAKFALLSPFHFIRTFKEVYGCTPYQYILEQRLNLACSLLKKGAFSITQVADTCGFTDLYNFSKAFKKRYGIAPSCITAKH